MLPLSRVEADGPSCFDDLSGNGEVCLETASSTTLEIPSLVLVGFVAAKSTFRKHRSQNRLAVSQIQKLRLVCVYRFRASTDDVFVAVIVILSQHGVMMMVLPFVQSFSGM